MSEFTPNNEHVTAVITSHLDSGENFDGAIVLGYYPENSAEVWIRTQSVTINVQLPDVDDLCRQLKRAKKLAAQQKVSDAG